MLLDMLSKQECEWKDFISYKTLPKTGYIALLNDQPVAVGFLRRVEGGFGQLDTFATNPYFGSKIRNIGINLVVNELMDAAKRMKLHGLMCFTKDSGILSRAQTRSFKPMSDTLLIYKL